MQAVRSHVIRLSLSVAAVLAAIAYPPSAGARVAGGSGTRTDCYSEFDGITAVPNSRPPCAQCVEGHPCATDGVCGNGFCEFKVRLCVNQVDAAIPICKAPRDGLLRLHVAPRRFAGLTDGLDLGKPSCGAVVPVAVATHFGPFGPDRPGRQSLRVLTVGRGAIPTADFDNVTLLCRPRPANRPCSATTSSTTTTTSTTTSSTTTSTVSSTTTTTSNSTTSSTTTSTTAASSTTSSTTTTVTSTTASSTTTSSTTTSSTTTSATS